MIVYIIAYFFIIFIAVFTYIIGSPNAKILFVILSVFALTLVAGLRGQYVGVDTISYHRIFYEINSASLSELFSKEIFASLEPGYVLLNRIIGLFTNNSQVVIFLSSALAFILFGLFLYRTTDDVSFAFILLYTSGLFFTSLNLVRQVIAIGFISNALWFCLRKKYLSTTFYTFLAFSFHYSSIIFIPLFLIFIRVRNKKWYLTMSCLTLLMIWLYKPIYRLFLELMPKYSSYDDSFYATMNETVGYGALVWLSMFIVAIITYIIRWDRKKVFLVNNSNKNEKSRYYCVYENYVYATLTILFVTLSLISLDFWLMSRISIYFSVFYVALLSNLISKLHKEIKVICKFAICILYFLYFLIGSKGDDISYYFFFQ